jgi:hypothetical protein
MDMNRGHIDYKGNIDSPKRMDMNRGHIDPMLTHMDMNRDNIDPPLHIHMDIFLLTEEKNF